jgi:hypothetical protein
MHYLANGKTEIPHFVRDDKRREVIRSEEQ